ncbi:hypothetical protein J1605_022955 [Eschrichtius robustus]|uniref:PDZ and LIM domain protein 7 n=1 Tax=Eschrichtius robustus TaxID=9764 RepID=A0AB34H9P1_ESCRO|nr:hypothetical protein J1605_022955 [Eschrichtius robustus]
MPQNVVLPGPAPWGFRLSGGIDFNQPLIITRPVGLQQLSEERRTDGVVSLRSEKARLRGGLPSRPPLRVSFQ